MTPMRSTENLLESRLRAQSLRRTLAKNGIRLSEGCDLAKLLRASEDLGSDYLLADSRRLSDWPRFFRGMDAKRIVDAILPLAGDSQLTAKLSRLARSRIDILGKRQSVGKDILWECEVLGVLIAGGIRARFGRENLGEPDIVVEDERCRFGVECKCTYSGKGIQSALSKGVRQAESAGRAGVVAFCLDGLLPAGRTLKLPSSREVSEELNRRNLKFIETHKRHFLKYLLDGRVSALLFSNALIADVEAERPQFRNTSETALWCHPDVEGHLNQVCWFLRGTL